MCALGRGLNPQSRIRIRRIRVVRLLWTSFGCGGSSVVEHHVANVMVVSSNLITRSVFSLVDKDLGPSLRRAIAALSRPTSPLARARPSCVSQTASPPWSTSRSATPLARPCQRRLAPCESDESLDSAVEQSSETTARLRESWSACTYDRSAPGAASLAQAVLGPHDRPTSRRRLPPTTPSRRLPSLRHACSSRG